MTEKTLFFIDKSFVHFGIAKSLQNFFDCEMSVIFDLNYVQKKDFQNQKLVNFKKTWFIQDEITKNNKKPDVTYLENFEKKYEINLWMIAYSERLFFMYNKYYKFNHDEILSILEQECKFYEKILEENKPSFLLIRTTDWHRNHLLVEICKAKKIHVLMLNDTRLGNTQSISSDFDKLDFERKSSSQFLSKEEIILYLKKFDKYKDATRIETQGLKISFLKRIQLTIKFFMFSNNSSYRNFYENFGRTFLNVIKNEAPFLLKMYYRKSFMNKNFIKKISDDQLYVYFPLHMEPERILSLSAPFYMNQIEVITHIAKSLPVGYKLLVKEHFFMKFRAWRDLSFYKKIMALPNVDLVLPSVDNTELLQKCSLVITINSTAGFEACQYEKPSIVFSDVSYSILKSVFHIKNITELPSLIRKALDTKVDISDLANYLSLMESNSFEFDMNNLLGEIYDTFFYNGFFYDASIPMDKMKIFLDEHNEQFDKLAKMHIQTIKQLQDQKTEN